MRKIGAALFLFVLPIGAYLAGGRFVDGSTFPLRLSKVHSNNTFIFSVLDNETLAREIPHVSDSCYGLKMKISYKTSSSSSLENAPTTNSLGITAAVDEIRQQHKMINIVSIQKTPDQKTPKAKVGAESSLVGAYSSPAEYRCARSVANIIARTLGLKTFKLKHDPRLYLTGEASLAMTWIEQIPTLYEAQTRLNP